MTHFAKTFGVAALMTGLAYAPALAQDASGSQTETNSTAAADGSMSSENLVASQEKVLSTLEQAGYTETEVMDAAYIVRTQTPEDETVVMMIDASGRVMGSSAAGNAAGQPGGTPGGNADTSAAGSNDAAAGSSSNPDSAGDSN